MRYRQSETLVGLTRREFLGGAVGAALAAACGPTQQQAPAPSATKPGPGSAQSAGQITAVLPASDLAVGPNRFLVAILDARNRPIPDASVLLRFFKVIDARTATFKSESDTHFYGSGLGDRGVYVARAQFDEAGEWGAQVLASKNGQAPETANVAFQVREVAQTPALGALAVTSSVPTSIKPDEIETFCSARPVDDMHALNIEQAMAGGKPFALLFASPGFCRTATCGPSMEVLERLRQEFGPRLNYLHVEAYRDPHLGAPDLKPVPAVLEWKLPSEPWLFIVDGQGRIYDKFEGGITFEETAPVVRGLGSG